ELILKPPDRRGIKMLLPVEGGRAVIGEQLLRKFFTDRPGELTRLTEIGSGRFTPDHIAEWRVRKRARYCKIESASHAIKSFRSPVSGHKQLIERINVALNQLCTVCIRPRNNECRNVEDVAGEPGCNHFRNELL